MIPVALRSRASALRITSASAFSSLMRTHKLRLLAFLASCLLVSNCLRAETGEEAWLRYARLSAQEAKQYESFPSSLVILGDSPLLKSAQQELTRGIKAML